MLPMFAAAMALLIEGAPPTVPVRLSLPEIAAMPHVPVTLVAHGATTRCEGVPLTALLAKAGLPAGEALRGKALSLAVVAIATDGYAVPFTLGELDPALGNAGAVIADRCDGKPLDAKVGPLRLIVPGEARPARSERQVERILVVEVPNGASASGAGGHNHP